MSFAESLAWSSSGRRLSSSSVSPDSRTAKLKPRRMMGRCMLGLLSHSSRIEIGESSINKQSTLGVGLEDNLDRSDIWSIQSRA